MAQMMDPLAAMRAQISVKQPLAGKQESPFTKPAVGKADAPGTSGALATAKRALGAFVAGENDAADKAVARQALALLAKIAS